MALFVYGLEIPVKYKFIGPENAIIWMKTQVYKKVNEIVKKTEHSCLRKMYLAI